MALRNAFPASFTIFFLANSRLGLMYGRAGMVTDFLSTNRGLIDPSMFTRASSGALPFRGMYARSRFLMLPPACLDALRPSTPIGTAKALALRGPILQPNSLILAYTKFVPIRTIGFLSFSLLPSI